MPALMIALGRSKCDRRGAGSGRARPSAMLTSAKGMVLANTHGQGATASTSPPMVGAAAAELVTITELMPSPRPS